MDKSELREQAKLHRDQINPASEDTESLFRFFIDHVHPGKDKIISLYWPIGSELDTRFLIDDLIRAGHKIALPVTHEKDRLLTFRLWDGKGDLVKDKFGTFVPPEGEEVEPDILMVPLLAFDRAGHRMGYGRGHYDATLAAARQKKEILAVGVGYAAQAVLFNLPAEPHDEKLDMVLTPAGVRDFR